MGRERQVEEGDKEVGERGENAEMEGKEREGGKENTCIYSYIKAEVSKVCG